MVSRIMSCVSRCRVCLTDQGDLQSLFFKNKGCSPYDKLISVMKISISLDSSSKFICFACMSELDIAVNFITKFQKAEAFLKDLYKRKQEDKAYIREQSRSPNEIQYHSDDTSLVVRKHNVDIFDVQKRSSKNFSTVGANKQKKQCPKLSSCTECIIQDNCDHYAVLKSYSCNICGKKFNKKDNLIVHIKRHSGERDWGCEVCGARHYTAGELKAHCRTHAGERPFACNSCPKRFTARTNLRIHQRIHTGEKPYICAVCGKRFSSNKLTAHARTHTGERPHSCSQCSRAFGSSRALAEHSRTHSRPAVRSHACPSNGCPQRYAHSQSLKKHVRKQHPHLVNNVTKLAVAST